MFSLWKEERSAQRTFLSFVSKTNAWLHFHTAVPPFYIGKVLHTFYKTQLYFFCGLYLRSEITTGLAEQTKPHLKGIKQQ